MEKANDFLFSLKLKVCEMKLGEIAEGEIAEHCDDVLKKVREERCKLELELEMQRVNKGRLKRIKST